MKSKKEMNEYMRKRYANNPKARAAQKARALARYHNPKNKRNIYEKSREVKLEVLTHYSPKKILRCCWENCMISDLDMLSLDHIENDGAEHRKKVKGSIYPWIKSHGYPEGFQTLCANHQWKKEILRRNS